MRTFFLMTALLCTIAAATEPNTLTTEEADAGFQLLFDGQSLNGWTKRGTQEAPANWVIEDGTIFRKANGGDISTAEQYADFELRLQWKVAAASNSGIFFRDPGAGKRPSLAPEMQVLDNVGHDNGQHPKQCAGSCYALYAPSEDVTRPVGEWNDAHIIARGPEVEYWLNGTQVVTFTIGSDDWNARVADSKFKKRKGYAEAASGFIVLQDHQDPVWYRSIRIRNLSAE